jgi:prepilin-type N-terminal cleavage/methylation domain-containing protein
VAAKIDRLAAGRIFKGDRSQAGLSAAPRGSPASSGINRRHAVSGFAITLESPSGSPGERRRSARSGFSLVELLAVVAILGTLVSLSLPAVQNARESARRSACSNNLRQMGIAILNYESARRWFPPGDDALSGRHHAWSSFILPFLEEEKTAKRINYSQRWNDPRGNAEIADVVISTYVCPSGIQSFPGKQDYGGVLGSSVRLSDDAKLPPGWEHGGVLYATSREAARPCRAGQVSDGLSRTLLVSEGVDRGFAEMDNDSPIGNSRWACGTNCFLHSSPLLNTPDVDGFRSHHLGGVHGLYGDGRVEFLVDSTLPDVLAALCTKAGGEAAGLAP